VGKSSDGAGGPAGFESRRLPDDNGAGARDRQGRAVIEIQLTSSSMLKTIAVFDGRVVEFFFDELRGGTRRIHVGHIRTLDLAAVAHGKEKYQLTIHCEYQLVAVDVSEAALPKAQELVAAIQAAMLSLARS
jgi:hypothetical protein